MDESIVRKITKSSKRKSFFHFTRVRNLPSMAYLDALYSTGKADEALARQIRTERQEIQIHGHAFVANAHLRIADQVMDAGMTHERFHAYLDRHVFLWPTQSDGLKMLEMYTRRERHEDFAILQLDAQSLLKDFYDRIKLSKYDSGSSPRYPARCSYKKSLRMFLPLDRFGQAMEKDVPTKPSEIKEVLVEEQITGLSRYLQAVYSKETGDIPGNWSRLARSLADFKNGSTL
ncbi:DUF7002 family protein [Paenibacillus sacheonensis]|uniref:DUF4433 domain-containing protein n=1 Tax=Paenibacillus sacheonensis TaxID=742054 RepID=A0A7X4YS31_9BACL|nr:hypothetical protein [Paenibacillus sacheonensis]MBM7566412.1 hypothetical protein [Paenibacillus sacheonensis]NBC70611.1 hypothetical protein [Paenibacillus sacheonensis]